MSNNGTGRKASKKSLPRHSYNCNRCPAYCCSYPRIVVEARDLTRLAKHFSLTEEEAAKKYTKPGEEEGERILRHKGDEHYGTVCRFLNRKTRGCMAYKARPGICREFPGGRRCGYYDFLSFERQAQEEPDYISTTCNH
jgi:Fe-S-cluster containining protein